MKDWLDTILGPKPKKKKVNVNKIVNSKPMKIKNSKDNVEVHNHFHMAAPQMPNQPQMRMNVPKKKFLSAMESFDDSGNILNPVSLKPQNMFVNDSDGDGVPNVIDPAPNNPNIPNTLTKQLKSKRVDSILNSIIGGGD